MKVRIRKCGRDSSWYYDKVGEVYDVRVFNSGMELGTVYELMEDDTRFILASDCEIIEAEAESPPANCEQCVELAEALSALLADYEHLVLEEGQDGPPGNMLVARTLLDEISDGVYTYE